jgi:quinol monooxygenase YgiN
MVKVALLVRLEVKPGHKQTVADFLAGALPNCRGRAGYHHLVRAADRTRYLRYLRYLPG